MKRKIEFTSYSAKQNQCLALDEDEQSRKRKFDLTNPEEVQQQLMIRASIDISCRPSDIRRLDSRKTQLEEYVIRGLKKAGVLLRLVVAKNNQYGREGNANKDIIKVLECECDKHHDSRNVLCPVAIFQMHEENWKKVDSIKLQENTKLIKQINDLESKLENEKAKTNKNEKQLQKLNQQFKKKKINLENYDF